MENINGTDQDRSPQTDMAVDKLGYLELQAIIISETDVDLKSKALQEKSKRIAELETMGILNRGYAKDQIIGVIVHSEWDKVYSDLVRLGKEEEMSARQKYPTQAVQRYAGAIEQGFVMAANQVRWEGLEERRSDFLTEEDYVKYLNRKLRSSRGLQRLDEMKRSRGAQVFDFGAMQLAPLVGSEISDGERVYNRLRDEEYLPTAPPSFAARTGEVIPVREVEKMPPEEQYIDFLNKERWSDENFDPEYENNTYYMTLRGEERENFRRRVKLHFAAWTKKRNSWSFEAMTGNKAMQDLSIEDIQHLYEAPGVSKVLKTYVDLIDRDTELLTGIVNPVTGEADRRSLRRCTNRYMINSFRVAIMESLEREFVGFYVNHGYDNDAAQHFAKKYARDAEQIGFNLAIVSNLFESLDARWIAINRYTGERTIVQGDYSRGDYPREQYRIIRERGFQIFQGSTDIMNKPIRTAFNPIDALVEMAIKPEEKETDVGVFTKWASVQIRNSLRRAGYGGSCEDFMYNQWGGFSEIELIDDEDSENYWKVERMNGGGYRLYAPECYPLRQIGSYWEDTSALDPNTGEKKNFLQFIRDGEEIPFDYAYKAPGLSGYLVDSAYWAGVWTLFNDNLGKQFDYSGEKSVLKILGNVGERNNHTMRRWVYYASKGLDPDQRLPMINMDIQTRRSLENDRIYKDYLPKSELYFSWDKEIESREERHKRRGTTYFLKEWLDDIIKGPQ